MISPKNLPFLNCLVQIARKQQTKDKEVHKKTLLKVDEVK